LLPQAELLSLAFPLELPWLLEGEGEELGPEDECEDEPEDPGE